MTTLSSASDTRSARRPDAQQPEPPDDPRNRLLDAFEQFIAALRANDMGLQAREIVRGQFPELFAEPSGRLSGAPSAGSSGVAGVEAELELAALITDCGRLEKMRLSGAAHAAIARLKARAKADLETIRGTALPGREAA